MGLLTRDKQEMDVSTTKQRLRQANDDLGAAQARSRHQGKQDG